MTNECKKFYVHRKGTFVGNAPAFWAKGGNGALCKGLSKKAKSVMFA